MQTTDIWIKKDNKVCLNARGILQSVCSWVPNARNFLHFIDFQNLNNPV